MGGTINEQFPVGVTKTMVLEGQLRRVTAERDALRAELAAAKEERDQLAAHVERLVGALECVPVDLIHAIENGDTGANVFLSAGSCKLIGAALAATPDQSLEAVTAPLKANVERLQKALEEERTRLEYDKKHRSHKDYVEVSVDELNERIEAISSALFSTKEGA